MVIPCNLFITIDIFMYIDVIVYDQRSAPGIRGESLTTIYMFEGLMDVGVSDQGLATAIRGKSFVIFSYV